jgi:hypothetical protein
MIDLSACLRRVMMMTFDGARAGVMRVLLVAASALGSAVPSLAASPRETKLVYTVNVLCGFAGRTSINVYNPNHVTVPFTKMGMALETQQGPTQPGERAEAKLMPNWALVMDCDDIAALGAEGSTGMGDVIIESNHQLDIWIVHTSIVAGGGYGETRLERVLPTRIAP